MNVGGKKKIMRDKWLIVQRSCDKAITILRSKGVNIQTLTEENMPANWSELKRLHTALWRRVYSGGK